jgi:hypothetical protein
MKTPTASASPTGNTSLAAKFNGPKCCGRVQDRNDVQEIALRLVDHDVGPTLDRSKSREVAKSEKSYKSECQEKYLPVGSVVAVGTSVARCPPHRSVRALASAYGSYLGWVAAKRVAG